MRQSTGSSSSAFSDHVRQVTVWGRRLIRAISVSITSGIRAKSSGVEDGAVEGDTLRRLLQGRASASAAVLEFFGEGARVIASDYSAAFDEKGRCFSGTTGLGTGNVTLYALGDRVAVEVRDELVDVESYLGGIADEIGSRERVLAGEHEVQPFPEHVLPCGGLCCMCGNQCVRMDVHQR